MDKNIIRITAVVNRSISPSIMSALSDSGILDLHVISGREVTLHEKKGYLAFLSPGMSLLTDPVDVFTIVITSEIEDAVISTIIERGRLDVPGRGSVWSEAINIAKVHPLCKIHAVSTCKKSEARLYSNLSGICCITQRGEGDKIAKVALDVGGSVPSITYGEGTGLRDKLGLLRITIPAEKEIINFVVSSYDAEEIMDMMIDVGKLDQPGKGFIYIYPVKQGLINTRVRRDVSGQMATMEQIIYAVDELKGGTAWRQRSSVDTVDGRPKRDYLHNLVDLILICNEGYGVDLVKSAMSAGAAGATISKLKYFSFEGLSGEEKISPARELCSMIVSEKQIPTILEAIEKVGAFNDESQGQLLFRPVPKACTYLGK